MNEKAPEVIFTRSITSVNGEDLKLTDLSPPRIERAAALAVRNEEN